MQYPLYDALNDIAVIRTTFETLDLFPEDDPIRMEILPIISDARDNLVRRFTALCAGLRANSTAYDINYERFKISALRMMTEGIPTEYLSQFMKDNLFDACDTQYYHQVLGMENITEARQTTTHAFSILMFNDILQAVQDGDNYTDGRTFRQKVAQKYFAFFFIYFSADDPFLYWSPPG